MRSMSTELFATLMIIVLCWIVLVSADAILCGLLKLIFNIRFRRAFLWGLISLALPPLIIAVGTFVERNRFEVKEVEIFVESLPEDFDGYRMVHISDIHARSFIGREKQMQKAVEKINDLHPDLIAFTGDLITITPDEMETISPILSRMKSKDGIFSVLGNHDYCIYSDSSQEEKEKHLETLIEKERELGWTLLLDEHRMIGRGQDSIAVIGVRNTSPSRHFPSEGNLNKASEGTEGLFRIVLSHDPMHWASEILGTDYPLTLSGHTHAMQFSLFGWSPSRIIFKHHRGLYTEGDQHLYVNTGLGETIFPARIGVRPEITSISLRVPQKD